MEIGSILRRKRVEKGLSQLQLAKALGYKSAQYVSNWERGVAQPPLTIGRDLVRILDIPISKYKKILINDYKRRIDIKL